MEEEIEAIGVDGVIENETAMFDGYVEVSTDARTSVWRGALKTWAKDPLTMVFGVGLGGAQNALAFHIHRSQFGICTAKVN